MFIKQITVTTIKLTNRNNITLYLTQLIDQNNSRNLIFSKCYRLNQYKIFMNKFLI